jgi:hypothetical protein
MVARPHNEARSMFPTKWEASTQRVYQSAQINLAPIAIVQPNKYYYSIFHEVLNQMNKLTICERKTKAKHAGSRSYIKRNRGQLSTITTVEINGQKFEMVAMHPMGCVRLEADDHEFVYGTFFDAFNTRRIRLEVWTKTPQGFDVETPNIPW